MIPISTPVAMISSAAADLIVHALRTAPAVQTAAAQRLADVLAAEAAISGGSEPRPAPR
jgi:hypothetical protein